MQPMSWLPCTFIDEHVFVNGEGHLDTQVQYREAVLQFGQAGDILVNPHTVTFMVTASKVDLRSYMEGGDAEHVECEVRRYSTQGIQVLWPSHRAREYDHWFKCSLKHSGGQFRVIGFLRHTPAGPPPGQEDHRNLPVIGDKDLIVTSAAMVLYTRTPVVRAGLLSDQKLHCQFAVDHKGPKFTAEWRAQRHGDWTQLFSYSNSGKKSGTGVTLLALVASGDVSLSLPLVKIASEGKYVCSVSVSPLTAAQDITLDVVERPRVSLNVGPELSLVDGGEQKVVCEAEGYYPLDVKMEWYREAPGGSRYQVGSPLPKKLDNILLSSHKHSRDGTFWLSAFFYLSVSVADSGSRFSCEVSHSSLLVPVRKSFTLTVHEPSGVMLLLSVGCTVVVLLVILFAMLRYLHSVRQESWKHKPY